MTLYHGRRALDNPEGFDKLIAIAERIEAQLQRLADIAAREEQTRMAYGLQAGNTARKHLLNFQQPRRDGDKEPWAPLKG